MCGISAILSLDGHQASARSSLGEDGYSLLLQELGDSLSYIRHRGPDAKGTWISDDSRVALGHVRLSINDTSPRGNQPFPNDALDVIAVVNGEVYNSEELKCNLLEPYNFKGHSDCEIVILLYLQYGHGFLSKLNGEFEICLYDKRSKTFIAARDRLGVKPLYWIIAAGRLLISAEMKVFPPLQWAPEWDVKSIREDVEDVSSTSLKHTPDTRSAEEIITGVRDRLMNAAELRMKTDVPVGIYLSGGIDSSTIAGMVAHLTKQKAMTTGTAVAESSNIRAFTIEFEGTEFNEAHIAQQTADFLGIPLHRALMTKSQFADRFAETAWHSEHHVPELAPVGKRALSELAREKGFKVVLSGEGSDEHFGGYIFFLADFLRESDETCNPSKWDDG
ncbi:nucleophile aminohydrolase [Calycina marina]|uniref:Nucleophile aminohydrolase n=1 Tax=Calycina marina TaxID=1763456 RepID=A0A9P7Z2C4_9HELO|nr:nucleophile aminohydrolase [Calycina marina]